MKNDKKPVDNRFISVIIHSYFILSAFFLQTAVISGAAPGIHG